MVETTRSATPLEAVKVEASPDGRASHVWLRKNIEHDVADMGHDEAEAVEFWQADEIHFVASGALSASEAADRFEELWAAHESDGLTDSERIAVLEQANGDYMAALLELGDIIGGDE